MTEKKEKNTNTSENTNSEKDLLGTGSVSRLMLKFAIPSIIAMIVGALYNIIDQIFIGQSIGPLGNAATNIAFPFTTICMAVALLFGIGGASCFNLAMGKKQYDKAPYFAANSISMLVILGILIGGLTLIFVRPLLKFFGSPDDVLPYAIEYSSVTAIGFPFLILQAGGGHIVRADGSPKMTMISSLAGAIVNTVLDAIFIFGLHLGMRGAALATIIGQAVSSAIIIVYMTKFKTVKLKKEHFIPNIKYVGRIASIGMASFFTQISIMIVQIVINKSLKHYGALSEYGESIPIACAGLVMKFTQIVFSIVIGLAQGTQPIESFNYGAKNYSRVKKAYFLAMAAGGAVSVFAFFMFQFFPRQLISIFGTGSDEYFRFGIRFMRIYLFFLWITFMQPITSTFFTSIGKPLKGVFLSLTRQIIFFVPLLLILPLFFGIDGIIYTGPVADLISAIVTIIMVAFEFKAMSKLERNLVK